MVDQTSQKMIRLSLVAIRISTSNNLIKMAQIRTPSKSQYHWMTLASTTWSRCIFSPLCPPLAWMAACKAPSSWPKNKFEEMTKPNLNTSRSFLVNLFGAQMYRKKRKSNLWNPFSSWLPLISIEHKIQARSTQRRAMKVTKRMNLISFKEPFRSTLNNKWWTKNKWNCSLCLQMRRKASAEQTNSRIISRYRLCQM